MKISVVVDSENSWFVEYAKELCRRLEDQHEVKLVIGVNQINSGDIAFFLSITSICPPEILNLNKNNIVIHASDLPKGKGWSPMPWQIIEGKNEITLTLFEAAEKVDSGDIYIKDSVMYEGHELLDELQAKLSAKIIDMAVKYVKGYDRMIGTKQAGKETYYKKRTPKHSELDIYKTIHEQFNLLRTVDNDRYPAFFYKDGIKYVLSIEKET